MQGSDDKRAQSSKESPGRIPADDTASVDAFDARTRDFTASSESEPHIEPQAPPSLGRYEVREELGRGNFGTVYEGFDPRLNRRVAIKVPHLRSDVEGLHDAFLAEARRLAQLRHHGIVSVHDVGVEEGRCYIVSDFLEGRSLQEWLSEGLPSWRQSVRIVAQIADALAHAHSQSTVHRDVKPANVILLQESQGFVPKLVDFGLGLSEMQEADTEEGLVAGTPAYMSPEQILGMAHRIDGRTDIYSLGVVLYEMLCGRRPFRAKSFSKLARQIRDDPPQPPRQLSHTLPEPLERICLKALAKAETDRFSAAGDFASALREVLDEVVTVDSGSGFQPLTRPSPAGDSSSLGSNSSIRRARGAERRQLTVMVCNCDAQDPEESMTMLDPEVQSDLVEAFHQLCENAILRFGGAIVQSSGQELLTCFGYPVAYEDAPQRAVRAGLAILDEMQRLNENLRASGIPLAAWVTVHTGMAIASETTDGDSLDSLSITGDARQIASRLELLAEPEQLLISETTHQLVKEYFVCKSQGTHQIKGFPQPLEAFQVLSESQFPNRVELVDPANLTPLVGRDMELGMIKDRWEHAEEGMGQVVLLIGDAGLGKSRLVREVKEHLSDASPDASPPVIEWRCSAYHMNSSLYPAIDFFQRLLGFARGDTPEERLDQLAAHLEELGLTDPEQLSLFCSLLSLPPDERCPPLQLSPVRHKERVQKLMLEWLSAFSARSPVLFIVEDLHWIDPSTLEFLALHVNHGVHDSILTLLTFRPDFRTPWASLGHQSQVALTRLTKRQIGEMIKRKTGLQRLPVEIVEQVAERTDGVPLFVEEFTKIAMESGNLTADAEGVAAALSSIPASLQDLLVARLDRMASDIGIVQLGATFGREFSYELLQAAADVEPASLQRELDKLVQAELLFQKGNPPHSSYIFKHALIQDAAYNSLVKKKRHRFHAAIADVVVKDFPETAALQPELVAYHLSEAERVEEAIQYWLKAGQRAQEQCAPLEAISHLQRGLQLIERLPERPQRDQLELAFQMPMGAVLLQAKGYANDDVGRTFERARELCTRLGPEAPLFHVTWGLWVWNVVVSRLDTCLEYAQELAELAEQTGDDGFRHEAEFCLGISLMYTGRPVEARQHLERGFQFYDPERCRFHAQFTGQLCGPVLLSYLALTLWHLGLPERARQVGRQAVDLAKTLGHPFTEAFALYHFGWLNHYFQDAREIAQCGSIGHRISHEGGFALWESLAVLNQGIAKRLKCGPQSSDTIPAMHEAAEGLRQYMATGAGLHLTHCCALFADLLLEAGALDEAADYVQRGFQLSKESNDICDLAELHRIQGELALRRDPPDMAEAESCFQQALATARTQNAKSWELRATISLYGLEASRGNADEGRRQLQEVYDGFTEGLDTHDLVRARAILDEESDD